MPFPLRPFLLVPALFSTLALARAGCAQDATAPPDGAPAPTVAARNDTAPIAATASVATGAMALAQPKSDRKTLSPAQRRQQVEDRLRVLMNNVGLTVAPTQDAIIDYLSEDEAGRVAVREAEKKLALGVRRDVPPERMRDLIADYKTAADKDKARRAAAQNKLDARVGYSFAPKLEAMLWLMGVLGDGASKLPTGALAFKPPEAPPDETKGPIYGPLPLPGLGARGEIVGTVTTKGVSERGEHWLEIRDDSGATDRYSPVWRDDLRALDPDMNAQLNEAQVGARVRVQWIWQERRRALELQPENAPRPAAP